MWREKEHNTEVTRETSLDANIYHLNLAMLGPYIYGFMNALNPITVTENGTNVCDRFSFHQKIQFAICLFFLDKHIFRYFKLKVSSVIRAASD